MILPPAATTHPDNKQDKNTNPIISRQDYHLIQPCPSKRKNKLSTNLMLHKAYTNHWTNLRQAETKKKKEFNLEGWEKETSNTVSFKRQRNTAQMKDQTRNKKVQINEEEIGKLSEKEFRIMIAKMIKTLENKMEKMQESIKKKDLE